MYFPIIFTISNIYFLISVLNTVSAQLTIAVPLLLSFFLPSPFYIFPYLPLFLPPPLPRSRNPFQTGNSKHGEISVSRQQKDGRHKALEMKGIKRDKN